MPPKIFLDTNSLIRFLLDDHPIQSPAVHRLFSAAKIGSLELYLDPVLFAETVWVLKSFYKVPKAKICQLLRKLLLQNYFKSEHKKRLLNTLNTYKQSNFDYTDAWLYTQAKANKCRIATFDRDFDKLNKDIRFSFK